LGEAQGQATHEACARCHGERMSACATCHETLPPPAPPGRRFIREDLHFSHLTHERDRLGREIGCPTCHESIGTARTLAKIDRPALARCASCHDDAGRAPPEVKMARCEACHLSKRGTFVPRTHLPRGALPEDHTIAFRRDHADEAKRTSARCPSCHLGLSGGVRDSCAECHALTRPRDHTITWREEDHGPEAVADRSRCSTCHASDSCEACHRLPPRSHSPMAQWVNPRGSGPEGHAAAARLGQRACFACHTFESSCTQCHGRSVP
jgi:hypothetical protein